MDNLKILWADDEIEMLKPQLIHLEQKGHEVIQVTNGHDAIDELKSDDTIDIVFLDESMPSLTGLETLEQIKAFKPDIPVVMITKNESEQIMEEAIGSQIADYLTKPVNPNQIIVSLKKIVDNNRLVTQKTNSDYQKEFRNLHMDMEEVNDLNGWKDIYLRIINWELRLDKTNSNEMGDILSTQKNQANAGFSRFVKTNYKFWYSSDDSDVVLSDQLLRTKIFPNLDKNKPSIVLLLDNLRYDQWKVIEQVVKKSFRKKREDYFVSMLPTATQYSRNAIFAGMTPAEIAEHMPQFWLNDFEEGGKNNFESDLLDAQMKRLFRTPVKYRYTKVTNLTHAKDLEEKILDHLELDISFIVYNFIDTLSHARTEMEVLKELAGDEKAYRSITLSWFQNSPLWSALQKLAERDVQLFITTDHGTIRVQSPSKVIGDKDTTTNLRYKMGRNLRFEDKDVFTVDQPSSTGLPTPNISSKFIFALEDKFFLYPNNYNYYNNYFRDTFQHGGVSLEEMICPVIELNSK